VAMATGPHPYPFRTGKLKPVCADVLATPSGE